MCEVTDHVHVFRCMQPGLTYIRDTVVTATSDLIPLNFKGGWGGGIHYDVVQHFHTHTHKTPSLHRFGERISVVVLYILYIGNGYVCIRPKKFYGSLPKTAKLGHCWGIILMQVPVLGAYKIIQVNEAAKLICFQLVNDGNKLYMFVLNHVGCVEFYVLCSSQLIFKTSYSVHAYKQMQTEYWTQALHTLT